LEVAITGEILVGYRHWVAPIAPHYHKPNLGHGIGPKQRSPTICRLQKHPAVKSLCNSDNDISASLSAHRPSREQDGTRSSYQEGGAQEVVKRKRFVEAQDALCSLASE
jgi:hypothetical protein